MKTNVFTCLVLTLFFLSSFNPLSMQAQFCETFDLGQGNWTGVNANVGTVFDDGTGNTSLDVGDASGESWVLNGGYDHHNIACGTITYDYTLLNDGVAGSSPGLVNQMNLISNLQTPSVQLRAVFVLNTPITENTGLVNISIPIHPIGPGDPLPSNNLGSWQMTDPTQWNALISSFAGVAFFVDVVGSSNQTEHFQIDNFCFVPMIDVNVGIDIDTECGSGSNYTVKVSPSGPGGVTFNWVLFQTDQPNQTSGGVQVSATQTGASATFSGLEAEDFYYVQLTLTDMCGGIHVITEAIPYHAIESIFHFEDADGNPQTTFCYGEDVFLNGAASFGENNYWIGISRRPYPNNGQGWQNWADVSWTNGQVPSDVNLSAEFAAINYDFEPGWEYNIKLAVQNVPACVNWVETVHTFVVECCDDFFDPKYILVRKYNPATEMYVLEAVEYELYSNVEIQHTWTILTSPNLDGGPYTLEAVLTGDQFSYEVPGELCYFVIHTLETLCGTWCYGESDCINAGESLEKEACDLCGPIDCSFLKDICLAPGNPKNQCIGAHPIIPRLKWDAVAGALGYIVEITWNDDKCCETELPELTLLYQTGATHLDLNTILQPDWKCLRWRVRAICDKGEEGWTEYLCFMGCNLEKELQSSTDLPGKATLFPNPATNRVLVGFEQAFTGTLQLVDRLGRVIHTQQLTEAQSHEFDLTELPVGFYYVIAQSDAATQTYKLVKQ